MILVALMASCTSVHFEVPQPKGGQGLNEIPKELQGTWVNKKDTCKVFANGYTDINAELDSLGNVENIKKNGRLLSDSTILNKGGAYYVANFLGNDGNGYQVVIIEKKANGEIHWYYPATPPFFGSSKDLVVKKVVRRKGQTKFNNQTLENVEGESIDQVFYLGQFSVEDIKKITIRKNTIRILKPDGTFEDSGN